LFFRFPVCKVLFYSETTENDTTVPTHDGGIFTETAITVNLRYLQ